MAFDEPVRELSLFTGGGGGLLGSKLLGWRTVCAVEFNPKAREMLMRRQEDGVLDLFPIWDDVKTFNARAWRGSVDLVSGGFPCQPWSQAGTRSAVRGEADPRNLWPDTCRILAESGATAFLFENVPGLLARDYFKRILSDLDALGFAVRWDILSASSVGAPHLRKRLWIAGRKLADAESLGVEGVWSLWKSLAEVPAGPQVPRRDGGGAGSGTPRVDWWSADPAELADAGRARREGDAGPGVLDDRPALSAARSSERGAPLADADRGGRELVAEGESERAGPGEGEPVSAGEPAGEPVGVLADASGSPEWWGLESRLGRVADGVAGRVDRLRALGNGQVPAVVRAAWHLLGAP